MQQVGEVRQGKVIDLELAESDPGKALAALKDMCEKLLANTVIEKIRNRTEGVTAAPANNDMGFCI